MTTKVPSAQIPSAIQVIFEKNRNQLDQRVSTLEEAVAAMLDGGLDDDLRARAEVDAHKLAGSLGMFGLPRGSELARELEQALALAGGPGVSETPRFAELVEDLRNELETPLVPPSSIPSVNPLAAESALLFVSPDPELTDRLTVEALARNMRPRSATTCEGARRLAAAEAPDAAVLDLSFAAGDGDGLDLLEELGRGDPSIPVLVLTGSDALVDRVEVARRGAHGFVARTRPASQLVDAVSEQIAGPETTQPRILTVDDDSAISDGLTALLGPLGLDVTSLNDPLSFWPVLESAAPDLLILDLDMPGLNGIDLCQAVRADDRFGQVPIVFLTADTSAESVHRIFEAGADDYVTKPVVGPELTTRVLNRLDRVRLYRDLAEKDSLTGVASRRTSTAAIERLLTLADRYGQPVSLVAIDLDHFKGLNDSLGHATGDAVLRRFGELLGQTFRGEDVIGRWGGEEFVVGMYGMARDDGVRRVAEILETFREERFTGRDGASAQVSFSAGVAEYPIDGSALLELHRAADEALYEAKAAGRDRVVEVGASFGAEGRGPEIVVVEDDETVAGLLIDALEALGYRTRWLKDGKDALSSLTGTTPVVSPSLVLLDVGLPTLDGISVLRQMAADDVLRRTRVIMVTALSGETDVVEALELGAFDHVAKPFSLPVLMQRVTRALRR